MVEQPTSQPEPSPLPASGSHASPDVRDADGATLHTELLGDLTVPGGGGREAELQALSQRAAVYASRARGDGTRRVYRSAWRGYVAWCQSPGREPLAVDPGLLATYAIHRAGAGVAVGTLLIDLAAIHNGHQLANVVLDLHHPQLAMVVEGITHGGAGKGSGSAAVGMPAEVAAPARPLGRARRAKPAGRRLPLSGGLGARDCAVLLPKFSAEELDTGHAIVWQSRGRALPRARPDYGVWTAKIANSLRMTSGNAQLSNKKTC